MTSAMDLHDDHLSRCGIKMREKPEDRGSVTQSRNPHHGLMQGLSSLYSREP